MEKCDLFEVHEFIVFSSKTMTKESKVALAQKSIFNLLDTNQNEFLEFVLSKYIETGVEELDQERSPDLLDLKYQTISDASQKFGGVLRLVSCLLDFRNTSTRIKWLKIV